MSQAEQPTLLTLHTLDTLCDALVSGRGVVDENGVEFRLHSMRAQALFDWYRRNRVKWGKNNTREDVEALVDELDEVPPNMPRFKGPTQPGPKRVLHLRSARAHRFAGLQRYGTPGRPPPEFSCEFHQPLTLIEGANGSGKTSLLSAITWCLTGYALRPQRPPERIEDLLAVEVADQEGPTEEDVARTVTAITPLPGAGVLEGLHGNPLLLDTWVELSFVDDRGVEVGRVRRTLARGGRARITVSEPDFASLGLDPAALAVGTRLPALIPYIQPDTPSELGKAVAALTGLAPLLDVVRHAEKSQAKLRKDLVRDRQAEIEELGSIFFREKGELDRLIEQHATISPPGGTSEFAFQTATESMLTALTRHFESVRARTLDEARTFLGATFDASDRLARQDLLESVGPAMGLLDPSHLATLPAGQRLGGLGKVTEEELAAAEALLKRLAAEAQALTSLARLPAQAARSRLYARVAGWLKELTKAPSAIDKCPVCQSTLEGKADPVTGKPVADHLDELVRGDIGFLEKTIATWEQGALATLRSSLPAALRNEVDRDLPATPGELIGQVIEDLLASALFNRSLAPLRESTRRGCRAAVEALPAFAEPEVPSFPAGLAKAGGIGVTARRLARALAFARWRQRYAAACRDLFSRTIGKAVSSVVGAPADGTTLSLGQRLAALDRLVKNSVPLTEALARVKVMHDAVERRGKIEARIARYARTADTLEELRGLRELVEGQVTTLMNQLSVRTQEWKALLYAPAVAEAPAMSKAEVAANGSLRFAAGMGGSRAAAGDVSNASDLRATLLAFLLAYREHLLATRGGLSLLLLDDPRELLDPDNRRRLASTITAVVGQGGRVVMTTADPEFAHLVARDAHRRSDIGQIDQRRIQPAAGTHGCLELIAREEER